MINKYNIWLMHYIESSDRDMALEDDEDEREELPESSESSEDEPRSLASTTHRLMTSMILHTERTLPK